MTTQTPNPNSHWPVLDPTTEGGLQALATLARDKEAWWLTNKCCLRILRGMNIHVKLLEPVVTRCRDDLIVQAGGWTYVYSLNTHTYSCYVDHDDNKSFIVYKGFKYDEK